MRDEGLSGVIWGRKRRTTIAGGAAITPTGVWVSGTVCKSLCGGPGLG
jgi:hypothetical protein